MEMWLWHRGSVELVILEEKIQGTGREAQIY